MSLSTFLLWSLENIKCDGADITHGAADILCGTVSILSDVPDTELPEYNMALDFKNTTKNRLNTFFRKINTAWLEKI